jgi:hypothetical protein
MKTETNNEEQPVETAHSNETIEATKQLLTTVLEKAVDAIKETTVAPTPVVGNYSWKTSDTFAMDDVAVDFVVKCKYDGKPMLLGEHKTFTMNIFSAKGFKTENEALEFLDKCKDDENKNWEDEVVLMRTTKTTLNEIGHGE